MAKTYRVDISDLDWKILAWKYVNPNQHIDDIVTNRARIGIKELAEAEITRRQNDPNWNEPIPADYEEILKGMVIKSARQLQEESEAYAKAFVQDPNIANQRPVPSGAYPIGSGPAV